MRLIFASSNKRKTIEIANLLTAYEVTAYSDLIAPIAIEENGASFEDNALIKTRAVFDALNDPSALVIGDDSGIIAPILGDGVPGVYSARYAGENAGDLDNLNKLIGEVKSRGLKRTKAYYEAAIALKSAKGEQTASGILRGEIVVAPRGRNGFGYDPIFIPEGFDRTLGELSVETKAAISHRAKAIETIRPFISGLIR
ncbi:MAG: non-canonical purine NTP pyrophosphatase [Helicobacteraceae bacterium]|jgi:XTP/dITP diphosphohydrolase|nr:non-canonical purine NTP pyrophosphatase [Helicobacteraceae bacterium]